MAITYTDEEIVKLTQERKVLPNDWRNQLELDKPPDRQRKLCVKNDSSGNTFCIITNPGEVNPLGFSVILTVIVPSIKTAFSTSPL